MKSNREDIRILVISDMYPNKVSPINGNFIHNQVKYIANECQIKVISPVPYSPKFLWFNPKWKCYGQIPDKDKIDNVDVYYPRYVNFPGTWFRRFSLMSMYFGIKKVFDKIIEEFGPQIIQAHNATPSGYIGLMFSRRHRIPFVCSLRGSDVNVYPHYNNFIMSCTKQVISNADKIISVSLALKSVAEDIAIPREPIRVVYNGCDKEKFIINMQDREMYRGKMNIDANGNVITFIGEIKKNKGIYELIQALRRIIDKYPNTYSFIVGEGPEYRTISNAISSYAAGKKIYLLGNQPHSEIPKWLNASDIFVLPTYYEGLPNVVLEAMACGLPVIATNVGGIPEIIDNGKNGILIDAENVDSLIKGIAFMLKNKEISKQMGDAGRKTIEQRFSWARNAQEMIEIYNQVIQKTDNKIDYVVNN